MGIITSKPGYSPECVIPRVNVLSLSILLLVVQDSLQFCFNLFKTSRQIKDFEV